MEQYRKSSDKVAFVLGVNDSPQPPSLFSHIELDARAEGRDDVLLALKWVTCNRRSAFGRIDPKYVTIGALLKLARVEAMGKLLIIRIAIDSSSTEITLLVLEALCRFDDSPVVRLYLKQRSKQYRARYKQLSYEGWLF